MSPTVNRQVLLASRPVGIPEAEHFEIAHGPMPVPEDGQLLVRNVYLSVEPAMRSWVNAAQNYAEPVALGSVMRAITAGEIVESRHPGFAPGDRVTGMFGWQEYAAVDAAFVHRKVRERGLPLSTALGVLGLNGLTAYFGILDVGAPQSGDTVVVSTAAGAVGSCAGQIAKIKGCRTVGIAGGAAKVQLCTEAFGYDVALDYKSEDLASRIAEACPDGVDVYFDNTAGAVSDAVLPHLAQGARVVICGTASVASWDPPPAGPRVERHLLVKRARMQGFLVFDYVARFDEAVRRLSGWVKGEKVSYREDILDGLEAAPDAIAGLFRGDNLGKRLIRIAELGD